MKLVYNLLRYFKMSLWQKLIMLVMILACFFEAAMGAPKKAVKKAPAKKAPAKKASKKRQEEDDEDED